MTDRAPLTDEELESCRFYLQDHPAGKRLIAEFERLRAALDGTTGEVLRCKCGHRDLDHEPDGTCFKCFCKEYVTDHTPPKVTSDG